jgi:hypothetical protein
MIFLRSQHINSTIRHVRTTEKDTNAVHSYAMKYQSLTILSLLSVSDYCYMKAEVYLILLIQINQNTSQSQQSY